MSGYEIYVDGALEKECFSEQDVVDFLHVEDMFDADMRADIEEKLLDCDTVDLIYAVMDVVVTGGYSDMYEYAKMFYRTMYSVVHGRLPQSADEPWMFEAHGHEVRVLLVEEEAE